MYLILKFKISLFLFSSESTNLQGAVAFSVSSENSSCGHFTITMPLWVSVIQPCASCVPFVLVYFKFVFDNRFFCVGIIHSDLYLFFTFRVSLL